MNHWLCIHETRVENTKVIQTSLISHTGADVLFSSKFGSIKPMETKLHRLYNGEVPDNVHGHRCAKVSLNEIEQIRYCEKIGSLRFEKANGSKLRMVRCDYGNSKPIFDYFHQILAPQQPAIKSGATFADGNQHLIICLIFFPVIVACIIGYDLTTDNEVDLTGAYIMFSIISLILIVVTVFRKFNPEPAILVKSTVL